MEIKPIARIRSGFPEKFGVPRQSSLAPGTRARIVFEEEFRNVDAVRGLEGFSHIWLIWEFSCNGPRWQPTVRPPRLGGNRRMGVFATRSTFRPNPLGLSCVKLEGISFDEGPVLEVSGADLVDGTPIFDIKPYVPYADSHPDAAAGWVDDVEDKLLDVIWECEKPGDAESELSQILALDPRPQYIEDPDRTFGLSYRGYNVKFRVEGGTLTVLDVSLPSSPSEP